MLFPKNSSIRKQIRKQHSNITNKIRQMKITRKILAVIQILTTIVTATKNLNILTQQIRAFIKIFRKLVYQTIQHKSPNYFVKIVNLSRLPYIVFLEHNLKILIEQIHLNHSLTRTQRINSFGILLVSKLSFTNPHINTVHNC